MKPQRWQRNNELWVRNTSRYPDHQVWELAKVAYASVQANLVEGETMPKIIVKLTNCYHAWGGRAYWTENHNIGETGWQRWKRVLVRIGPPQRFPCQFTDRRWRDMPDGHIKDWMEAFVAITAHEIGHAVGLSGRKDGEMKCDMLALDAVEHYRKCAVAVHAAIAIQEGWALQRVQREQEKKQRAKDPLHITTKKLERAQEKLREWTRQQKLATTKVKQYARAVKRLEKRAIQLGAAFAEQEQPMLLAASPKTN